MTGAAGVFSIPASAPFLDTLVDAFVAAMPPEDPFALADAVFFVPNRRAVRGLVDAFARRLSGAALLPAIKPLADLGEDADVWGPDPISMAIPPAIAGLRRRMELARLVRARDAAEGGTDDPVRALAWADELCRLLDAAATVETADWSKLATLVEQRELAEHWRRSVSFLEIISDYWPRRLEAEGLVDPARRSDLVLRSLAALWTERPPQHPVVVAGSTGSVAATRALMRAVSAAPRGWVVLPGLDLDLDDDAWSKVDAQHPQFSLKGTLAALERTRADVAVMGEDRRDGAAYARRKLVGEAMAPADATADWRKRLEASGGAELVARAAVGLTILEAANEEEEAAAIALLLRETLETPGRSAMLVTTEAALARRVGAKLLRWGISPQTSIGAPLAESSIGVFLAQLAALLVDDAAPIPLLTLVKHAFAGFGLTQEERADGVKALEAAHLRGPRRHADLLDLERRAEGPARTLVAAVRAALAPVRTATAAAPFDLGAFAESLVFAAENAAASPGVAGADRLWRGAAGLAAADLLRDMAAHGADLGPMALEAAPRALSAILAGREAPPEGQGDPRIAILGPLEARLQRRDLVILGGLVEGVWPQAALEDPFLSRSMREAIGLPSPDARIGLSAHDFAQLANAPEAVLTRSLRRDGAPAVASRWLWRLTTLARAAEAGDVFAPTPARDPRLWARQLDAPRAPVTIAPPRPRPPVGARPRTIAFSRVETLIRDPYEFYARYVLQFRALLAPGAAPGARERGTALHAGIQAFGDGEDPARLLEHLLSALADAGFDRGALRAERARLWPSAVALAAWNAARKAAGYVAHVEVPGELELPRGRRIFGRADRIDQGPQGRADVIDFKTGDPPTKDQVESGLAPQLVLEAAALAAGGFKAVPALTPDGLIYFRFGGRSAVVVSIGLKVDTAEASRNAVENLTALFDRYDREDMAYLSKPRVKFAREDGDYDHFARRAEWADVGGDG